jgi:caffeoyl-CoA O-methyltransferase
MGTRDKFLPMDDALYDYMVAHRTPDDPVLHELREATARLTDDPAMQISPEEGTFLRVLAAVSGARRAVEVGTFTGYSSICIARGLAPGGRLLCCDVSEEWTSIARRHWEKAGLADRVELRLAPAAETLRALPEETVFDFAFIDADKAGYLTYYEEILKRLRPGGLIVVDNVLWHGDVVRPEVADESTQAIRQFNDHVAADGRVDAVMIPVSDGLTLARKR